jgi:hypothetical protein
MNKDNKADLIQCEVTWDYKIEYELKKHDGIKKVRTEIMKYKKWSTIIHFYGSGASVDNILPTNGMSQKKVAKVVKKEDVVDETSKKCVAVDNLAAGLPLEVMVGEPEDEPVECVGCCECPCLWLSKKQEMIYYDQMEHEYLWEVDMSPNNI